MSKYWFLYKGVLKMEKNTMNIEGYDAFSEGAALLIEGKFEESIDRFSEAIQLSPDFQKAYMSRGVALIKNGDIERAKADFDQAIELAPLEPKAYHFRGLTHLKLDEREAAKADFDKAIELDNRYAVAYFSRGTTLSEMGDLDSAGNDMVTAARIGEAHLQEFADYHNIWRTKYDKTVAELTGEREADWAVTPDLRSHLDG